MKTADVEGVMTEFCFSINPIGDNETITVVDDKHNFIFFWLNNNNNNKTNEQTYFSSQIFMYSKLKFMASSFSICLRKTCVTLNVNKICVFNVYRNEKKKQNNKQKHPNIIFTHYKSK